jgi:hypothetical protein
MKLKRFDPVIYPLKLWVIISKDGADLNGLFRGRETEELIKFEDTEYNLRDSKAEVFSVMEAKSGHFGILIIFTQERYMTCETIAHEAVHAAGMICKSINQRVRSEEYFAYLTGWIADCCWKYRTGVEESLK